MEIPTWASLKAQFHSLLARQRPVATQVQHDGMTGSHPTDL